MTKLRNVSRLCDFLIDGDTIKTCCIDFGVVLEIFTRLHGVVEVGNICHFIFLQSPNFFDQTSFFFAEILYLDINAYIFKSFREV
ncbi:MAG: hypothetical protein MJA29_07985, partial [Candidatus Omnitrophica bacterium]|nr:hypothetical protein [Candidatus Omnitrophota bacterium]